MTLKHSGNWSEEFERRIRANEVVTVRCVYCSWSRTGPALKTSKRGNEYGVLAAQRKHVASCRRAREARNARQRRYYERDKATGQLRKRTPEWWREYYAANAERIQARRRERRKAARAGS